MLLVARGAGADTRGVRRRLRFLVTSAVVAVFAGAVSVGGVAVANAPENVGHLTAFRDCTPVVGPEWEADHVGNGAVKVRFTIPRRTFVHEGTGGLLAATNTNEAPCVRDEFLRCDLEILDCHPASPALRDRVLTANTPPVWPGPGSWVSL